MTTRKPVKGASENAPDKAEPDKPEPSSTDGVHPLAPRGKTQLDPALAKIRDEEAKALAEIEVTPREDPSIDPALVKARDEEIKRQSAPAKAAPSKPSK